MAAGRHGAYRDNEFRVRESDLKLMRRKEFYQPKQESDRYRKGGDGDGDGGGGEGRRETVRSKEVKGGHYPSLINNSRGGFSDTTAEREPGELVTGIRSDDATFLESQQVRDKEVSMSENGVQLPARKKRKFSPVVWDREDKKEVRRSSFSNRIVPTTSTIPPLPSDYSRHSPNTCPQISPIRPNGFHDTQFSVAKPMINPCSGGFVVGEPKTGLYSSSAQEQLGICDHELGQMEAVDIVPRNEGVGYEEEDMLKGRKEMTGSQPLESDSKVKFQSLEQGELMGDESEGIQTKSSEAVEDDSYDGFAGKGEYPDSKFMNTDKNGSTPVHYSDTDSEDEKCSGNPAKQAQPRSIDMLKGCRSVHEFERLNKIDEGTYGVVFRARDKKTGEVVALKKVKMEKEREGFPLTSLREINILLSSNHPSIVDVKEVVMGDLDSVFMVMEYMDHDLKGLMETQRQPFSQSEVKCLMLQLLEGVKYLHDNWVLHRDLKTSNILFNNRGELKICDFGLSRQYGSPPKPYTQLVVTLWYRAPELLLGAKQYSTAIDMWSLGCIMAELLAKEPLFNGKTEIEQIDKIFRTLGTPSETIWPGFSELPGVLQVRRFVNHRYNILRKKFPPTSFTGSPVLSGAGFDLLNRLLTYDPEQRITAEDAVNHEWFREVPLPKSKDFMPTFPAQHAQDRRSRRIMKSPDPLEEQRRRELQQGESGSGGLFG